jgi:hypothetical protein
MKPRRTIDRSFSYKLTGLAHCYGVWWTRPTTHHNNAPDIWGSRQFWSSFALKPGPSVVLLSSLLSFSLLGGCTVLRSNGQTTQTPASSTATSPSPTAPPSQSPLDTGASARDSRDRPDTRVMPMTIEGQIVELELQLFNKSPLPFTTYVPKRDFQNEVDDSGQGTVAQFFFSPKGKKDKAAYVQIFLPDQQTTVQDMRELLIGENGLLSANRWQLVDRTDIVSYPWAREKLIYQQKAGKQNFIGSIYIGEHEGRSFYALTHYPAEYMDGFEPRSTIMLENLQFRDGRL